MASAADLTPEQRAEIAGLLAQGQKIMAIKVFREATGSSLLEAKNAVEAFEADPGAATASATAKFPNLTPEVVSELERLLVEGRKIEAIKRFRETTGCGLAEAKAAMDDLQRDVYHAGRGSLDAQPASKAFQVFAAVALVVVAGVLGFFLVRK